VHPGAELDPSVEVGPGAVIGPGVLVGPQTRIGPYVVIARNTRLGARNVIFQFASLGADPQDLKYRGEPSRLEIGDDNCIREFTTIHRGTEGGGMVTRIGNQVLVMNYVHVAHDCMVGDHAIVSNATQLGGHCVLEPWVVVAGMCGVHQFTRVGAHAMVAAGSRLAQDVPPFAMVAGDRARLVGVNVVGLERRGFSAETVAALRAVFRKLFYGRVPRQQAAEQVRAQYGHLAEIRLVLDFIASSQRGVVGRERD
jgi:UDP-N-acetylglucosamine acyltransferase